MDYILTQRALTAFHDNQVLTVHAEDERFEQAVNYVKSDDIDGLIDLTKPLEAVREYLSNNGRVEIIDQQVYFDGEPLHNYMAHRILDMFRGGFTIEPLINFMTNVAENPSKRAQDELLQFLEYGELPITPDGCFLSYKKVADGYLDCHSRTIDNSVGQVVEMPRNQVQDDPNITCSYGLHFCSLEYLRAFYGSHMMVLKINPRDVVSIPTDYNNTKGRCCRYEVVGELDEHPESKNYWGAPVVNDYEPEPESEPEPEVDNELDYYDGDDTPTNPPYRWPWH